MQTYFESKECFMVMQDLFNTLWKTSKDFSESIKTKGIAQVYPAYSAGLEGSYPMCGNSPIYDNNGDQIMDLTPFFSQGALGGRKIAGIEFSSVFLYDASSAYLVGCVWDSMSERGDIVLTHSSDLATKPGDVQKYKNFLERRGTSEWIKSKTPNNLSLVLKDMVKKMYNYCSEPLVLAKFYMDGDSFKLGMWGGRCGSFHEVGYGYEHSLDGYIEAVIGIVSKLSVPVQDVYLLVGIDEYLTREYDSVRVRKNSNGEYTMVIY